MQLLPCLLYTWDQSLLSETQNLPWREEVKRIHPAAWRVGLWWRYHVLKIWLRGSAGTCLCWSVCDTTGFWAQPSLQFARKLWARGVLAAMKDQWSRSVPLTLSSAWKMSPVIHCWAFHCTEESWMHEGQNLLAMFSFRERNGRLKGIVGGLEADACFLD